MMILDQVAALRAGGREVLSLCAGEPSQGAPTDVREAAIRLHSSSDPLGYSGPLGTIALKEAIVGHYHRWYGLDIEPESVGITTGASGAFVLMFLAAFDIGDRVAVARPGYPAYANVLRSLGMDVVELAAGAATGFVPTTEMLNEAVAKGGGLHGLVLASPANPTGSMIKHEEFGELIDWCRLNDVRLISDEIYHGITYPAPSTDDGSTTGASTTGPPTSQPQTGHPQTSSGRDRGTCAWSLDRSSVVVSSFSKYWGMTGWRLGWALIPEDLKASVEALAGNIALCPPTPSQHAALAAFTQRSYDEADLAVAQFGKTRQLVFDRLPDLGWGPVAQADGAFYLWANIHDQLGKYPDSPSWCRALLEQSGVALVPGTDMDHVDGHDYVRLSFAAGPRTVAEALERIVAFQQF